MAIQLFDSDAVKTQKVHEMAKKLPFTVTNDTEHLPNYKMRIPHEDLLVWAKNICHKPAWADIIKIRNYVEEFPYLPELTTYLSTAYQIMGKSEEANKVILDSYKQHPNYFFARINTASVCLLQGDTKTAASLLADGKGVEFIYPSRTHFLPDELWGYLEISVQYFIDIKKINRVNDLFYLYEHLLKPYPKFKSRLEALSFKIFQYTLLEGIIDIKSMNGNTAKRPKVTEIPVYWAEINDNAPVFHHPTEMQWLYEYNYEISPNYLRTILALPRETLIADLCAVAADTLRLYQQQREAEEVGFSWLLPEHSVLLLTELKSEKAIETLFNLLRCGNDFLDYWFQYEQTYLIEYVLQRFGKDALPALTNFLDEPNIDGGTKMSVIEAVNRIAASDAALASEITPLMTAAFTKLLYNPDDTSRFDYIAASSYIGYYLHICYVDGLPLIKRAFDMDCCDPSINGDWETVEAKILSQKQLNRPYQTTTKSIWLHYAENAEIQQQRKLEEVQRKLEKVQNKLKAAQKQALPAKNSTLPNVAPMQYHTKIGRNELCFCGSGKKYKKCCAKN